MLVGVSSWAQGTLRVWAWVRNGLTWVTKCSYLVDTWAVAWVG